MMLPDGFSDVPAKKVPMHPEDYAALREWVRAKEEQAAGRDH